MDIRPAATVVVARDAGPGVEVVVLRRSAASRFAPRFVVFPGGAVDAGDEALARRWFGAGDEAPRACALRELVEEAGLAMTRRGLVGGARSLSLIDPPGGIAWMPEISRWIAPDFLPVRFDARFFALQAPAGLTPVPDGIEADRAWWAPPSALLDLHRRGTAPLMWPTLKMLEVLAACDTAADVLALRVEQVEAPRPRAAGA